MKHDTFTGWGRVLSATGDMARPERMRPVAWPKGPAVGNLRSYGDAGLNRQGPVINMTRLDRCIAFDAETGILTAEAGITLAEILRLFATRGWMPAVFPGTAHATLGGAIAADVHGKNHEKVGTFGQHVLSIELTGPDGVPRTIGPDAEPDVFRATFGGMGLTGIITAATIQLVPCPSGAMRVNEKRCPNLDTFMDAFETQSSPYSVGWIDAVAQGDRMGRGILETAEFADPVPFKPRRAARTLPFDAPNFLLSPPVVRVFNTLYYTRIPKEGRSWRRPLEGFFFPLDGIGNWNKLYGKRGFHQFQCVLPTDIARTTLRDMLTMISGSGLASPLAVLKSLGEGRAGHMSFPMAGYTLAVDFPNSDKSMRLIGDLTGMTESAGGRIYLAKDALCEADRIPVMYPELESFQEVVRKVDPDGIFETDLSRRLNLRGTA